MSNPESGADPSHAIAIDETDTHPTSSPDTDLDMLDSDSDEDGGMQLDDAPPATLFQNLMRREGHLADSDTHTLTQMRGDESDFTIHPPNPFSSTPNPHNTPSHSALRHYQVLNQEEGKDLNQETVPPPVRRTRLREEQHAAMSVLNDWELLVAYALNNRRTIPQTRRHFQAKLLAPDDPVAQKDLYAMRFTVPASKAHLVPKLNSAGPEGREPEKATGLGNVPAYLVSRSAKEMYSFDGQGWQTPGTPGKGDGGKRGSRSVSGSRR